MSKEERKCGCGIIVDPDDWHRGHAYMFKNFDHGINCQYRYTFETFIGVKSFGSEPNAGATFIGRRLDRD